MRKVVIFITLTIIMYLWNTNTTNVPCYFYKRFKHRFEQSDNGKLPPNIDQIYCIRSNKRKDYITNYFNAIGLRVNYLNAIFPIDLTKEDYNRLGRNVINPINIYQIWYMLHKKSHVPIQISFAMCYLHAIEHGYKTIMVFEDDIYFHVDMEIFQKALNEFSESSMDMMYLGYCMMSPRQDLYNINDYEHIMEISNKRILCNHAIVLNTEFLKDYINTIFPINVTNDVDINNFCIKNNKRIGITKKAFVFQNKNEHESMNGTPNITISSQTYDFT